LVLRGRDLPSPHGPAERAARLALSDALIAELEAADTIVLALPVYNFSISSTLKAWINYVVRAGRTFLYTAAGPELLLKGNPASTARGPTPA
jgi:FMN-dependent NADH-azoreductase